VQNARDLGPDCDPGEVLQRRLTLVVMGDLKDCMPRWDIVKLKKEMLGYNDDSCWKDGGRLFALFLGYGVRLGLIHTMRHRQVGEIMQAKLSSPAVNVSEILVDLTPTRRPAAG
jgi:hypothetical protein